MADAVLLYGVVIRDAIQTGDKDLMRSVLKVSEYMLPRAGSGPQVDDWRAAQGELEKAVGS